MNYLIIGSDCQARFYVDVTFKGELKRIKGPIDNCFLLTPLAIEYILSGKYLEDIKNKNFKISYKVYPGIDDSRSFNNMINVVHNDPSIEKFKKESEKRIKNFQNYFFDKDTILFMSITKEISSKIKEFNYLFEKYPFLNERLIFLLFKDANIENLDFFKNHKYLLLKEIFAFENPIILEENFI